MIAKIFPKQQGCETVYFDIRNMTPLEYLRLMGVPEGYAKRLVDATGRKDGKRGPLCDGHIYRMAGNSIVCDVLMRIFENFLYEPKDVSRTDLFDNRPFTLPLNGRKMRVVTLCSGYDSQCIALEMLKQRHKDFDYELVAWAEFDPDSTRPIEAQPAVIAHNILFPQWAERNVGDMTLTDWNKLKIAYIDLLTYSTPCQSISMAGRREGMAKDSGTRSSLIWHTEKAIAELRPRVLLMENVKAIVFKDNRPDFQEWCRVLQRQGYVNFIAPQFRRSDGTMTTLGILNASDYGVAQNRERLLMVSIREDVLGNATYYYPRPIPLDKTVRDYVEEDVDKRLFLDPLAVVRFVTNGAPDDGCLYAITDHFLSEDEEDDYREGRGLALS